MDLKHILCGLILVVFSFICAQAETKLSRDVKRSTDEVVEDTIGVGGLQDDQDDKRIFRYGRGGLFRYGRGSLFRYGKRGSLFRYGKRDEDDVYDEVVPSDVDNFDDNDLEKRLFRWGKRDAYGVKRLFRWGKRSGEFPQDPLATDDIYDVNKRVFRYGKRPFDYDAIKRRVFRFGKRDNVLDDVMFKYGRDTRVPSEPHVPFRFGDEE